jgi:chaperone BCS1
MLTSFFETLQSQLQNQVVAGGVALALAGILITALRKVPGLLWSQLQRLVIVTAVIDSRNDIFNAYVNWLNDLPFGRKSRLFTVVQAPSDAVETAESLARDGLPRLLFSPAPGTHLFWHDGHVMWIERQISMNLQVIETMRVSMLFARRARLEAMLQDVLERANDRHAGRTQLFTVDQWGTAWRLADAKPRRKLESVVLAGNIREQLVLDIEQFFTRRTWYGEMGIPWRRGYLFYGPPGTGKTSLAFALAGELQLSLCTLSLTNNNLDDQGISDLLQRTPAKSLILIEDVDAFFVAREKQDARINVSFSGLLNAIDGVAAQEGRIVVLTTNRREVLDAALIRPGRIDMVLEIGLAAAPQIRALFLRFHPNQIAMADTLAAALGDKQMSPASVQQVLLAHPDPREASSVLLSSQP